MSFDAHLRPARTWGARSLLWQTALFLLTAQSALLWAQQVEQKNPHTSKADIAAGAEIYRLHCTACHGLKGEGGSGPDLTVGRYRYGSSDEALYRTIRRGIPGSEMPATGFPPEQIWQLVAFLRSLSGRESLQFAAGNPAKGKKLFYGKSGCSQCHWMNGRGGRWGPGLSDIGARRSSKHLRDSLLHPNAVVDPRYWQLKVVDQDGNVVLSFRLHEDTFSVRVLDMEENLRSLSKRNLRRIQISKKSSMPSYERILTESELNDLVAYLSSLGREEEQ